MHLRRSWLAALAAACCATSALADEADTFFDDSQVHEIRIWFDDPDWYDTLYNAHATDPDDPYFFCRFESEGITIDPCGVRFKGNSSFGIPGVKKSFKFDFDESDEDNDDLQFLGLKKLALNNGFKDPTLLREKLFLDYAGRFIPTIRIVHCRLYVNDEYWGLYTAVENVNKDFCQRQFGSGEDGNLFKAEHTGGGGGGGQFGSNLSWLGNDETAYYDWYELETNESEADYSQLVEFIDVLNNTATADLPEQFEPLADVDNILRGLALNSLFVNLDAYNGTAHNYYVYDRDDTGQFTHILWDTNEAFGNFRMGQDDAREMSVFWLPSGPPPGGGEPRPLMENLWAVDDYNRTYLRHHARFLRNGFDLDDFQGRIHELADLIRDDVYADTNKMYSNSQFEQNLVSDITGGGGPGGGTVYGLEAFVDQRASFLEIHLNSFASRSDLQVNEIMSLNTSTLADSAGDYDPWIEIYNLGPGRVNISNVWLSDDPAQPDKWLLPGGQLEDGDFLVLWIDGESGEGSDHASFALDAAGGTLFLSKKTGSNFDEIDVVTYPALDADASWGREEEESSQWQLNGQATPGEPNIRGLPDLEGILYINEFMADNESIVMDEAEEFDDWIELYNASDEDLDIGGLYLTDLMTDPTQWAIPEGQVIEARSWLLIWADEDADQGPLHADFKLGAGGEELGLFAVDGATLIDSIVFGDQSPDISMGRIPDGGDDWQYLQTPTPDAANQADEPELPVIKINELMADNISTIADEEGEYDDWIELYNPGTEDIDIGGLFLTDDVADPGAWNAPAGLVVPAGGFLLIWADDDAEQGDNHATFKLSATGEEVVIYASDGVTVIDQVLFGAMEPDQSYGRLTDGGENLGMLDVPTPGESNLGTPCPEDLDGDGSVSVNDILTIIDAWGGQAGDVDGNGTTDVNDMLLVIGAWGLC